VHSDDRSAIASGTDAPSSVNFNSRLTQRRCRDNRKSRDTSANESVCTFCFVLFFSRPRSEGWPHHGRTFSTYLCPLSFLLTLLLFHGKSCPRLDVVHPGRAWSSSPTCTWHCSLHYLFLQAISLFPHGVTIVC